MFLLYFLAVVNEIKIIPETVVWIIIYVTLGNNGEKCWYGSFWNSKDVKFGDFFLSKYLNFTITLFIHNHPINSSCGDRLPKKQNILFG